MILGRQTNSHHVDVIDAAIRQLVTRSRHGEEDFITLPIFHPSGAAVTVSVSGGPNRFRVSDGGQAYREVEMFGAQHLFNRNADRCAELHNVSRIKKVIFGEAHAGNLAGLIASVGAASAQISSRIMERAVVQGEAVIEDKLRARLNAIFGQSHVQPGAEVAGASHHKWRVSALVHVDGREIAFDAVSNHHSSVYSASTKFHDFALLDHKPKPIAVVENKEAMGSYLVMLSQAANVIEATAPDELIERLAA